MSDDSKKQLVSDSVCDVRAPGVEFYGFRVSVAGAGHT